MRVYVAAIIGIIEVRLHYDDCGSNRDFTHCKKEIVIMTKELLFEFQMRVTNVFSTFLKHSLTKECWNTL